MSGVHSLVEAQVAGTPDAIAVELGDERLSYSALSARANRIAHRLRVLGVGPDLPVGISVPRSIAGVTAILGALVAGGAYVPIDPAYPADRIRFMLEDAAIRVLLTTRRLASSSSGSSGAAHLVYLDGDDVDAEPTTRPPPVTTPDNLAYILYTSGSTGRSKGVAMPHGPLMNLIAWQQRAHAYPGPARTLHFASMSFDVSFQELFSTWTTGGTLVIAPEEVRRDPPALLRLIAERGVERAFLPPIVLQHIAEAAAQQGASPAHLREIIAAGEALHITPPVAALLARIEGCVLQNHYGPTETHVVTAYAVPRPAPIGAAPIGKPIDGTRVHLLDERLAPVPTGEIGEIYLGGACVARGYLHRPELTAERFIADPFDPSGRGRLYKTGDRGRIREDGEIEFHGRVDHQVKIRGHRVELGEVESVLLEHPAVRRAACAVHEREGSKILAAYVVAEDPASPPAAEDLRRHLADRLPPYMMPAALVTLGDLPLLPNGKLDRAALPAPAAERSAAPSTPTEELVAGIFAEVLGIEEVGARDDFLALGGHSLHATAVLGRVTAAFGVAISPNALFEDRTVERLAARIEAARGAEMRAAEPIAPAGRGGPLPLSFAQLPVWLFERLNPGTAAYNIPFVVRIEGPIDAGAIARSLASIVRRHEALRATFVEIEGEPTQIITGEVPFSMPIIEVASREEAERRAHEQAGAPFDLARGPLLRATLLRAGEDDHTLCLTMHHLVADGFSLGVLSRELSESYAGRLLPALSIGYADFVRWQRANVTREALAGELRRLQGALGGASATLDLPADRARPRAPTFGGATHRFVVPPVISAALGAIGRREGATLFMVFVAAFDVLLHRITGQDDLVVGTPVAARTRVETEGMVGMVADVLLLRARLGGDPTFAALLTRVRGETLAAYANQAVPHAMLIEDVGRAPLLQAMIVMETPIPALCLGPARVRRLPVDTGTSKLDWTLFLEESERGIDCALEYATDLFDASTIARMAGHFQTLLASVVADPERRIAELPLLTDSERRTLVTWSEAPLVRPEPPLVYAAFASQAARTPNAVAVVHGRDRITYADLDRRANRLAHHLRSLGVGRETLVGVGLRRSPALITALLGVLKAGGAYVPLDPAYPRERLAFMAQDAALAVLITEPSLDLPAGGAHVVQIDADAALIDACPDRPPPPLADASSAAYVLYTSGSTGRPKGVVIEHRGPAALIAWAKEIFSAEQAQGVLFSTSVCFDLSVFELFLPWSLGGAVILADDALALASLPAAGEVTLVNTVPSAMIELCRASALPASTQVVCLAGEPLTEALVDKVAQARPGVRVMNLYGPTEDTTYSTFADVRPGEAVTIGRPIAGGRAYILDRRGEPTPIGVAGEIHLAGAGLARGYLNRPELTADRFVHDPFRTGERMYRTGDLGRFRGDGAILYLGRIDTQVKVRGFRIELGEIEAALSTHPSVRACVVIAREDKPGDKRLVAYVAPNEGAVSQAALGAHLAETLPAYMVPSAFVSLDALPLTPNGKIDRSALPAPASRLDDRTFAAPRTPIEEVIAGIFADVLGVSRVGVHDDFFALGGHSLSGTRVMARITKAFGIEPSLRALFDAKTVACLAEQIERAGKTDAPLMPPLAATLRAEPPPLSFSQERLWLLDQMTQGSFAYNIPLAVRLDGALRTAALEQSLAAMVQRHEALRTTFTMVDGAPRQIIAEPAFSLPVIDLAPLPAASREAEARRLAAEEARRPFDLERGPLFRASLLRLDERANVLLVTVHHIISDGWSMGVFARELSALYEALSTGRPSPLAPLPFQYADVAVWQRSFLHGSALDAGVAYWREQLRGAPPLLSLPTVRPRPAVHTFHGATHAARLPAATAEALRALCRREGVTLFMALLAGFSALLGRYSGQDDIVVGSPIAGRTQAETEGLIGFFLNTLALRTRLSGNPSLRALCAQVREVTLGAHAHQQIPFERVIEALAPPRALDRTPIFQAYFNLLNLPPRWVDLPGLTAEVWPEGEDIAKFDVNLYAEERGDDIDLHLAYNTALFDSLQTRAMLDHMIELLGACAVDPDLPLARVPLSRPAVCAPPEETTKGRAAPGFMPLPDEAMSRSLAERFVEVARRAPEDVAIRAGGASMTYGALAAQAGAAAAALSPSGTEARVALLCQHGPAMVVAIVGALMAGMTYVPLDASLPDERLAVIAADAGVSRVLTHGPLAARAATLAPPGAPVIDLDTIPPAPAPAIAVSPDTPAYILFTSGSTGRPKGVVQSHRNALRHVRNYIHRLHLGRGDGVNVVASYAFDAAVMDIFGALLSGATLIPIDLKGGGLLRLAPLVREEGVTVYHSTPTVYRHLVGMLAESEVLDGVRLVVLGGEEADGRDLAAFQRHFPPGAVLINGLGPTESTLAMQWFADHDTKVERGKIPVGYPVEGVDVRLMTPLGEQAAVWGAGQIVLQSEQLALGYWNRPELTDAAFAPDPSGGRRRIYATGDLGRLLPGGAIEYLGRMDQQVKIRGHRIELGEIEARLSSCPGVAEAVVVAREDTGGEKILVGYIVPEEGKAPAISAVREHLGKTLPEPMIPSAFAILEAFPLLPNGKIDRRALPAPERPRATSASGEPKDEIEVKLAAIFRNLLGVEGIGLRDSFFDMGGHSMLAVQLVEAIQRHLGRSIPLIALFQARTVEQLAELVRSEPSAPSALGLVPIRPAGSKRPLFLVSRPNVNSLGYVALARYLDPERPIYGLQLHVPEEEDLGRVYTQEEYRGWATSYLQTIRLIQPEGPYLLGGMCQGALLGFEIAAMLEDAGQRVALLAVLDTWPEENTRRPLLDRLHWIEFSLRGLVAPEEGQPLTLARVTAAGRAILKRLAQPRDEEERRQNEVWRARVFPGERFVPRRIRANMAVFKVARQPYWRIRDAQLGWGDRTWGDIEVHTMPGVHTTFLREPNAAALGRLFDAALRRADAP